MSGGEIDEATLLSLLEASRWAPSANNNQPWRFIYARRNTPSWEVFYNLLAEGNQIWAKNAAVLIVVISKTTFDSGNPRERTRMMQAPRGSVWPCRGRLKIWLFTACRALTMTRQRMF